MNTGANSGSAGSTSELSTGSASDGMSSGTTLVLDVGSDHDVGSGKPAGCKGKIDFLFVVSRGAGMTLLQTKLQAAFPKFIETIETKFADFDYHIMVVDGDPEWGLEYCTADCPVLDCKVGEPCCPVSICPNCPEPAFVGDPCCGAFDYPCDYTATACDAALGAGVVFPAGVEAANKSCGIEGGRRYMVKGQTDLKGTFGCAAQLGKSGGAWMGEALTAAVQSNINDPGGCNPGFLRKDALLMVTMIANTYDEEGKPNGSAGTPETWTAAVRKAKGDDLASVVMFSILDTGSEPGCLPIDRTCQMVKMFPYSLIESVLVDDYVPAFEQAAELVETACADFVPG